MNTMKNSAATLALGAAIALAMPAQAEETASADAIEATFSGGRVTMNRGYDYLLTFEAGGTLKGVYVESDDNYADRGRWSVESGKLCTQWSNWENGQKHCYAVSGAAPKITASGGSGLLNGSLYLSK